MKNLNERTLEKIMEDYLENRTLEDFLEEFNIPVIDVVTLLYDEGFLDDYQLERLIPSDV